MSSGNEEYVLDANGKPLLDRLGRPVRRRGQQAPQRRPQRADAQPSRGQGPRGQQEPNRPQQYFPAQQPNQSMRPQAAHHTQFLPAQPAPEPRAVQRPQQYIPSSPQYASNPQYAPSPQVLSPTPKRKRQPKPSGCVRGFGWLLAVVLVLSVAGTLWLDTQLQRIDALGTNHIANTKGTNWLLVGSDSRTGMSEEDVARLGTGGDIGSMRTDTIMVLHLPQRGSATLLSIPRDSYVNIPGFGMDKANAAFAYGGAPLLTQTVEQATGLHIDHYAEIGMGGLANVVDAVGGIQVCPAEPIEDPLAQLSITAGCQQVDGPTALGYVRTRATAMGDLDRVERQREFFASLVGQLTEPTTLANPFRSVPTALAVARSFTVDDGDHIWHLLRVGLAMRGGINTVTVPHAGFASTDVGDVVLWDEYAAGELFRSLQ